MCIRDSFRFVIGSSTILIALVAVALAEIQTTRLRWTAFVATLLLALVTNPLLPDTLLRRQLMPQRVEYWKQTLSHLNDDQHPLVLCSNLVETPRLVRQQNDGQLAGQKSLAQYALFPILGLHYVSLNQREVLLGDHGQAGLGLTVQDVQRLAECDAVWLVIRAFPKEAEAAADNLANTMNQMQAKRKFMSRRIEDGPVNLFQVTSRSE